MRPVPLLLVPILLLFAAGCAIPSDKSLLMAAPLPDPHSPAGLQAQAVAKIKKLGGQVQFAATLPGMPVVGIDLHGTRVRDADLSVLASLPAVRTLNLHNTAITDAGLAYLKAVPHLQTLFLNQTAISDAGLEQLKALPELRELGTLERYSPITNQKVFRPTSHG